MNEWLDLMLGEIARKKREAEEAESESARRLDGQMKPGQQSKKESDRNQT